MDTLLVGNTAYFTKDTLETAFANDAVVICDELCDAYRDGNITLKDSLIHMGFKESFLCPKPCAKTPMKSVKWMSSGASFLLARSIP